MLLFWQGILGKHKDVLADYPKTLAQLAAGEYKSLRLEKLKGTRHNGAPVYSVRATETGKATRLLFTEFEGSLLFLEVVENHDYHKALYLQDAVLDRHLQKGFEVVPIGKDDFEPIERLELPPTNLNQHALFEYFGESLIIYDQNQSEALEASLPVVIQGGPGTGKTCILLSLISQSLDRVFDDEEEQVIYVAKEEHLVDTMREQWLKMPGSKHPQAKRVVFITYEKLLIKLGVQGTIVDKEHFDTWLEGYLDKNKRTLPTPKFKEKSESFYEEFCIISGCKPNEYEALGTKQSSIQDKKERQCLYQAYTEYGKVLKDKSLIHLPFFNVELQKKFRNIFVDEFQDLSLLQLMILRNLAINQQVAYCGDINQNLMGSLTTIPLLKGRLTKLIGELIIELLVCYRSAQKVKEFFDTVKDFGNTVAGGTLEKSRYHAVPHPIKFNKGNEGSVNWLTPEEYKKAPVSSNAGVAVIVPDQVAANEKLLQKIKQFYNIRQVLSVTQSKGLEFDTVIVDDFLSQNEFLEINRSGVNFKEKKNHRAKKGEANEPRRRPVMWFYIACSRSINTLLVVQARDTKPKHHYHLIENHFIEVVDTINNLKPSLQLHSERVAQEKNQPTDTQKESFDWLKRVNEYLDRKMITHAKAIYTVDLKKSDHEFDKYKKDYFSSKKPNQILNSEKSQDQIYVEAFFKQVSTKIDKKTEKMTQDLFAQPNYTSLLFEIPCLEFDCLISAINSSLTNSVNITQFGVILSKIKLPKNFIEYCSRPITSEHQVGKIPILILLNNVHVCSLFPSLKTMDFSFLRTLSEEQSLFFVDTLIQCCEKQGAQNVMNVVNDNEQFYAYFPLALLVKAGKENRVLVHELSKNRDMTKILLKLMQRYSSVELSCNSWDSSVFGNLILHMLQQANFALALEEILQNTTDFNQYFTVSLFNTEISPQQNLFDMVFQARAERCVQILLLVTKDNPRFFSEVRFLSTKTLYFLLTGIGLGHHILSKLQTINWGEKKVNEIILEACEDTTGLTPLHFMLMDNKLRLIKVLIERHPEIIGAVNSAFLFKIVRMDSLQITALALFLRTPEHRELLKRFTQGNEVLTASIEAYMRRQLAIQSPELIIYKSPWELAPHALQELEKGIEYIETEGTLVHQVDMEFACRNPLYLFNSHYRDENSLMEFAFKHPRFQLYLLQYLRKYPDWTRWLLTPLRNGTHPNELPFNVLAKEVFGWEVINHAIPSGCFKNFRLSSLITHSSSLDQMYPSEGYYAFFEAMIKNRRFWDDLPLSAVLKRDKEGHSLFFNFSYRFNLYHDLIMNYFFELSVEDLFTKEGEDCCIFYRAICNIKPDMGFHLNDKILKKITPKQFCASQDSKQGSCLTQLSFTSAGLDFLNSVFTENTNLLKGIYFDTQYLCLRFFMNLSKTSKGTGLIEKIAANNCAIMMPVFQANKDILEAFLNNIYLKTRSEQTFTQLLRLFIKVDPKAIYCEKILGILIQGTPITDFIPREEKYLNSAEQHQSSTLK